MNKKNKSVARMAVGVLAIVLAIICFTLNTGGTERDQAYGGDAYTGIQNASAQTARNIKTLASITKVGFGSILLVTGCYLIITSLPEKGTEDALLEKKQNEKQSEINESNSPVTETEAELNKFKELFEKGIITEEEYEQKRKQIAE